MDDNGYGDVHLVCFVASKPKVCCSSWLQATTLLTCNFLHDPINRCCDVDRLVFKSLVFTYVITIPNMHVDGC